jgi:hypothetical protein
MWLGGQLWTFVKVEKVPEDIPEKEKEDWMGDTSTRANEIRILKSTDCNERDTLVHELMHTVIAISGQAQFFKGDGEERLVSAVTPFVVEALLQLGWIK